MSDATANPDYKYRAFISYSHVDKEWADWLHKTLESYAVPSRLVGHETAAGPIPKRLFPIFRDRDELPTSADLGGVIESALRASRFLIVICSPHAAASLWVNEEILAFKRMGRDDRILAFIVDGEPNAADEPNTAPALECFPPGLKLVLGREGELTLERAEPLAADARPQGDGRDNARLKLIAGLLGVGFDTLRQRDAEARRRQLRNRLSLAAIALLVLIGGLVVLTLQLQAAQQQRADALARLAERAAGDGDFASAARFAVAALDGYDRPLIGFDPARAVVTLRRAAASAAKPTTLEGHTDGITAIAYAPDSATLATASIDSTARIWDAATGAMQHVLKGHTAGITAIAYAPNGRLIATASDDQTARLWGTAGNLIATLAGHMGRITTLAFAPDSRLLATGSDDRTARLWRTDTGATVLTLRGHTDAVWAVAFSPDGTILATGSKDKTVRLWDVATGAPRTPLAGHKATVGALTFSGDGRTLYTAGQDAAVHIWDLVTGQSKAMTQGDESLYTLAVTPDQSLLVTGGAYGIMRVWDLKTHRLQRTLHQNGEGDVTIVAVSPDGTRLLSIGTGGSAELWDLALGVELDTITYARDEMIAGAFAPDGRHFAYGAISGRGGIATTATVSAGRLRTDTPVMEYTTNLLDVAFSRDGRILMTAGADGSVQLWSASTGLIGTSLTRCDAPVLAVALSPDGTRAASACADDAKAVTLWDVGSGAKIASATGFSPNAPHLEFSPGGDVLAFTLNGGTLRLLDGHTGSRLRDLPGGAVDGLTFAFSPDSKRLALGTSDAGILIFDPSAGTLVTTLATPNDWTYAVAFSSDGRRFAAGGSGAKLRLWDAASFAPIIVEEPFKSRINAVAFSANAAAIAAASDDTTARVWDATTGQERAVLRGHSAQAIDVAFLKDGGRLATLGWDRTLRIWDVSAASELFRLDVEPRAFDPDHPRASAGFDQDFQRIHDYDWRAIMALAPSENRILTAMPEGTARFWNIPAVLTAPAATLAHDVCADLLRGTAANLTADERRQYRGFDRSEDDVCHPPPLYRRVLTWVGLGN
jgi:WD40 repeat protein